MPDFRYLEKEHFYLLDGIRLPSVTEVLPYNFYGKATDYHKDKGQYVHDMIHLYNLNDLDEENLDLQLKPYLEAYIKFKAEYSGEGICDIKSGSPQPVAELQVAAYTLLAREGLTEIGDKITIPTYEQILYHPIYGFAGCPDIITGTKNVYVVYLQENGKYKMVDHTKDFRRNIQIFLSFLTCHKWRKEKNL